MPAFPVRRPPLWLMFAIASLSVVAGAAAASQYREVARLILTEVLQPGREAVFLVTDDPASSVLLPTKLFVACALTLACPSGVAWVVTQRIRPYVVIATASLLISVLVSGFALFAYRQYMQTEIANVYVGGKSIGPRLRGEITPLGAVPVTTLLLIGPFVISVGGLLRANRPPRSTQ